MSTSSLILFNKPYGVQSQFRDDSNNDHTTLSQYFTDKSLRIAGRLDAGSGTGSGKCGSRKQRQQRHNDKER